MPSTEGLFMSRSNFFKNSIPPKGLWIKKRSGMQCSKTYLKTLCVCFTYRGEELTIKISQAVMLNAVLAPCLFVCFSLFSPGVAVGVFCGRLSPWHHLTLRNLYTRSIWCPASCAGQHDAKKEAQCSCQVIVFVVLTAD